MAKAPNILQKITDQQTRIRTTEYPMPIAQILSMYEKNTIQLEPKFQRFFRWKPAQKTRLIESLLLGIPVPPVFMSQNADGSYEVVDGVQRLSTVLEFMGELLDEGGRKKPSFSCSKAYYLPEIEGFSWNKTDDSINTFPIEVKNIFQYEVKLDFKLILRQSDPRAKYELFYRLNSGGTPASDQEIRNCTLIKLNEAAYDMLERCASYTAFEECCPLSGRLREERFDLELVLRFMLFRNRTITYKDISEDLSRFLHDKMIEIYSGKIDLDFEEQVFKLTFDKLLEAASDDAFRLYRKDKKKFYGAFSLSCFEVVALGLGYHFTKNLSANYDAAKIFRKIKALGDNTEFRNAGGSGVSTSTRLPKTLMLGRNYFKP